MLDFTQLKTVDLTDFDFSTVRTMACWFYSYIELEEVIFPEKVNCKNLTSLTRCFFNTNITSLNMANWNFQQQEISVEGICKSCSNLKSLILQPVNIKHIRELAQYCENLQLLDLSKLPMNPETLQYMFLSTYYKTLDKANSDCIITEYKN